MSLNLFSKVDFDEIFRFLFPLFRLQRRNSRIQKHFIYRVGCRWTGQNSTTVASLLPKHPGSYFRRRLLRSRAYPRVTWWASQNGKTFDIYDSFLTFMTHFWLSWLIFVICDSFFYFYDSFTNKIDSWTKMSSEMQLCLYLQTNKICRMRYRWLNSQKNLAWIHSDER